MIKSLLFSFTCITYGIVAMDNSTTVVTTTNTQPKQPRMAERVLKKHTDSLEKQHEHCCILLSRLALNGTMVVIECPVLVFDSLLDTLSKKNN